MRARLDDETVLDSRRVASSTDPPPTPERPRSMWDPREPFDIRQSSLHLEYTHGGVPPVDSARAKALYETYFLDKMARRVEGEF